MRKKILFGLMFLISLSFVSAANHSIAKYLVSDDEKFGTTSTNWLSQSFNVSDNAIIECVHFKLDSTFNSPVGFMEIWAVGSSDKPTGGGNLAGYSEYYDSNNVSASSWNVLCFGNQTDRANVTAHTKYAVVWSMSLGDFQIRGIYGGGFTNGTAAYSEDSGSSWDLYDPSHDLIFNVTSDLLAPDTTPPSITSINCTSCVDDSTPDQAPYETADTTPTFDITTNENAWCRIADEDWNYTTMGSSRDCTSGDGTEQHTCTLNAFDELKFTPIDYAYIGCKNNAGKENTASTSGILNMTITNIGTNSSIAIERGITTSSASSAAIYTNQQVYVRDLSNNQALGTFDKVAVYGGQRWAFNYIDLSVNESSVGTFYNLTPIFYFLEMVNLTSQNIINQVATLINTTKT